MKERESFVLKRKSVIIKYVIAIILVLILGIYLLIQTFEEPEVTNVQFTESSNMDYKVYLKENDFFKQDYIGKDNQYIASLIDYIEADFNYQLKAQQKNESYKYTYRIEAETNLTDAETNNSIFNEKEVLVKEKEYSANTSSILSVKEKVTIDYNKYNDLVKSFIEAYDLEDYIATLTINMYADVIDFEGNANAGKPVMTLSIPLTTKTMAIDIESNEVNQNIVDVHKTVNNKEYIYLAVGLLALALILGIKLRYFIKDTESELALYEMKLRKIMTSYSSYVQKISNEYYFGDRQILEVRLFEDLLQIRETINKPILMLEGDVAMDTYFFIASDDTIYLYELQPGSYKRNKASKKARHPEEV